jgi:N-acetyl-gamma-glutamyl-phosphate reductase
MAQPSFSAAVLGASGYTGGELIRLLLAHPNARIAYVGVRDAAQRTLAEIHPYLAGRMAVGLSELSPEDAAAAADVVLMALPNGNAKDLAPRALEAGARVVDLSGDFRLPAESYPEWYGWEHPSPAWLDKAVYGLPEWFAERIASAGLVANPGCYTTTAILGLAPLIRAGLVDGSVIRIDGKSGLSGAGRAATEATSYVASSDSVRPYRFPKHQHTPEFEHVLGLLTGQESRVIFVPHLVPSVRGVLCTSYVPAGEGASTESLTECLVAAYEAAPFVRVLPPGGMTDTKRAVGSNVIELQASVDPRTGTAVVIGALDNLVKGAAGQAVQNCNLMFGLEETTGLSVTGVYP